ncbi:hypothetical protein MC7420_1250 [Coleofasciculus chthonoplastes PCC 7420]|uniref:Uncharacterized protein n=1 Tax=Coleofasciculus chthonoplastes PCC 7420 TaxID=118168 RepID=B4VRT4_9CYAN|nr:hypothetical protein MC7420_1250 [Coleofasciculus chthonoplastes PCC 7420]
MLDLLASGCNWVQNDLRAILNSASRSPSGHGVRRAEG